jgi:hypothetical protein
MRLNSSAPERPDCARAAFSAFKDATLFKRVSMMRVFMSLIAAWAR